MGSALEVLRRGRTQTAVVVASAFFVILGLLSGDGIISKVFYIVALLALGVLAVSLVAVLKRLEGNQKLQKKVLEQLSIEYKSLTDTLTPNQTRLLKEVRQARSVFEGIPNKFSGDFKDTTNKIEKYLKEAAVSERENKYIFDPSAIGATRILEKPSAQAAGRSAATQVMESEDNDKLRRLLSAPKNMRRRRIVTIASASTNQKLLSVGDVEKLMPGQALAAPEAGIAYVVVEETAFDSGVWAGALSTTRTNDFLDLVAYLKAARMNDAVVVIVEKNPGSRFSHSLRQQANITVQNDRSNLRWHNDSLMPVLELLVQTKRNI